MAVLLSIGAILLGMWLLAGVLSKMRRRDHVDDVMVDRAEDAAMRAAQVFAPVVLLGSDTVGHGFGGSGGDSGGGDGGAG